MNPELAGQRARGRRVVLEMLDGAAVAIIEGVADDVIRLRLLDELPEGEGPPVVTGALIVDEVGLFLWPARVEAWDGGTGISVAVIGPGTLLQRRRHDRIDVDLPATV